VKGYGPQLEGDADQHEGEREEQRKAQRLRSLQRRPDRRQVEAAVSPYTIEIPYNSAPDESAPSTKYFIAASAAIGESRSKATIAYSDSDSSSSRGRA
jgi:hypothetical protein